MFVIKPAEPKDYYTIKQFYEAQGKRLELSADLGMLVAHEDGFAGLGIIRCMAITRCLKIFRWCGKRILKCLFLSAKQF